MLPVLPVIKYARPDPVAYIHTHIHIQIRHLALELAETEVADSEVARAVDEEVAGLEVSVNYRRPAVVH